MTEKQSEQGKLVFPCEFTLKIFGNAGSTFETTALMIVKKHIPTFSDQMLQIKESSKGKYAAISITFMAESQEQLDAIYRELSSHKDILMAL